MHDLSQGARSTGFRKDVGGGTVLALGFICLLCLLCCLCPLECGMESQPVRNCVILGKVLCLSATGNHTCQFRCREDRGDSYRAETDCGGSRSQ